MRVTSNRTKRLPIIVAFILLWMSVISVGCQSSVADLPNQLDQNEQSNLPTPVVTLIPSATLPASPTPNQDPTPTLPTDNPEPDLNFDGESAYQYLLAQMEIGPRFPGSPGHEIAGDYIIDQLEDNGWLVEEQIFPYTGLNGRNIIGRINQGVGPVIIVGAHYDTRKLADKSPNSIESVPGAVDGASGVAVLLELARILEPAKLDNEIWLAFFDLEDNGSGGMPGFNWIVGSTYMAENLKIMPEAMVLVDMVGDADQQLYYEGNSDPELQSQLWQIGADLGYVHYFIPEYRYTMIDDHLPFAQRGIPAVDIIDFDYPYYHTVDDTADKASSESLARVGETLEYWLISQPGE